MGGGNSLVVQLGAGSPASCPSENCHHGKAAVPLILEKIGSQGGLWFHVLSAITGANPVAPEDRGNVAAMQESWLKWGQYNGYG